MARVFVMLDGGVPAFRELEGSPYRSFLEQLSLLGDVTPHPRSPVPEDVLVAFEPNSEIMSFARAMRPSLGRKHMIIREPKIVRPDLYSRRVRSGFDFIWAQSPTWARELGGESFLSPLHIPDGPAEIHRSSWETRSPVPVLLLANKYSAVRGEMYWLRRGLMRESGRRGLPIDVIGSGWQMNTAARVSKAAKACATAVRSGLIPRLKIGDLNVGRQFPTTVRALGNVEDKYSALASYQVAFVPENSREYVSEKLLDAVIAGCIPIYVGGDLSEFGFPEGLCLTPEPTPEAMWDAAEEVARWSWERKSEHLEIGQAYVHSDRFVETWRNDHALSDLGARIVARVLAT